MVAKRQVVDDHDTNEAFLFGAEHSQDSQFVPRKHQMGFSEFGVCTPLGAQMGTERSGVVKKWGIHRQSGEFPERK